MSDRHRTTITIDQPSSRSDSLTDEDDHDSQEFSSSQADDLDWSQDLDELDPNDSASASADYPPPRHPPSRPTRNPSRRHSLPQRQHHRQPFAYQAPNPPPMQVSSEASDEYGYGRYPAPVPPPAHSYYGSRGHAPAYPQSVVGGYPPGPPGPYHPGQQVVPYNNYNNPFSPMNHSSGASYFGQDPRGSYDVMPYQGGYYGGGGPGYGALPPHMQQFMYNSPPPPPPTEPPVPAAPTTPAPPAEKKPDPELEMMKAQLEVYKAERAKKEEAEKQAMIEEKIRKDTEDAFERRMDAMRKAQEEAKKEIEKAKIEAEKAARERIEAERKAEEERAKMHAEAMARAERDARDKLEAERRADDERKKREAEAAALAEAAAKARIEAQIKADEDARKAAEKKAADEAEWRKKLEEEAKLKAELEARQKIEAERKAAEDAAAAEEERKKAEEALRNKIMEEAKVKAEEAVKGAEKAPIKFKDAVGRKFSFPFHLCQTWTGMEELIKQAFLHVEVIGPHVQEGHYDLIGPNGEIILPSVWEKVVQPDWAITMHMWPMDKNPLRHHPNMHQGQPMDPRLVEHMRRHGHDPRMQGRGMPGQMPPGMRPMNRPAPGGGGGGQQPPMPPGWMGRGMPQHARPMPQGVNIVDARPPKEGKKSDKKGRDTGFMSFLSGKPAKSSSKNRKK